MSWISTEQQVIKQIRRDNGVDEELVQQARRDPIVWNTVTKLKQKLEKSLQILSDELYSKPAHFVLELLQNADDNSYAPGTTPEMRVVLRESYMEIQCNETGFTAENVRAFCGIGQSTKKNQTGYIGEKGIGAKSMFKVAKKVHVHSLGYHFVLDRDAELGMISPQWTGSSPNTPGWTLIRLDFCDDKQYAIVKKQLAHVRESVLLFMRRLARLKVDDGKNFSVERDVDGPFLTVLITNGSSTTRRAFLRVAKTIQVDCHEPKREHSTTTEVVLAFPLDASREPLDACQMVHAFLPMRSVGFKFIIQADFLTAASREDVLSDLQWNKMLRSGVVDAFCSAIPQFQSRSTLAISWLRFLPDTSDISGEFFSPIARDILARVKALSVIRDVDGAWLRPSSVKFPSVFSEDGIGLVPEPRLPFYYASNQYSGDLESKAKALGVEDMAFDDFLAGLCKMGDSITTKGNVWLERVCAMICSHGFSWRHGLLDKRVRTLPLVPLTNGTWISRASSTTLFLNSSSSDFPSGLGIDVVRSELSAPRRRELLERLGVRDIDRNAVVQKIVEVHARQQAVSTAHAVEHAVYAFENERYTNISLSPRSLCLVDTDGDWAYGSDLYMNGHDSGPSGIVLSDVLSSPARFIHSSFMTPSPRLLNPRRLVEWRAWLQSTFGVSTVPRVSAGTPTEEFEDLIDELRLSDCGRLLSLLRHFWPGISTQTTQQPQHSATLNAYFSALEVRCICGRTAPLASTFVLNRTLARFATPDLLRLPVPDPDGDWSFLRKFGVSTDVDAKFFLKRLIALAGSPSAKRDQVYALYQQLNARGHECPDEIRSAFEGRNHALFFVDGEWHHREDVVWDGPVVMTLKTALAYHYPSLAEFFRGYLQVPDAPPTIIADELRSFSEHHTDRNLSSDELDTLYGLLTHADSTIKLMEEGRCDDWTTDIRDVAIFPVHHHATGRVVLAASDEESFFIRDPSGVLSRLFPGLTFLELTPSTLIRISKLLAHLGLYGRRLERHVSCTVLLNGAPMVDGSRHGTFSDSETAEFKAAVPFIARLQFPKNRSAKGLIRSITVHEVDTISVSYTLDDPSVAPISQSKASWARSGNSEGSLELYISSDPSWARKDRFSGVIDAIVQSLDLQGDYLHIAAILRSDDPDELDTLLTKAGFPAPDERHSSLLQRRPKLADKPAVTEGLSTVASEPVPRDALPQQRPSSPTPPQVLLQDAVTAAASTSIPTSAATNSIDMYVQSTQGRAEMDRVKAAAMQSSLPSIVALDSPVLAQLDLPDSASPPGHAEIPLEQDLEALGLSSISIRGSRRGGSQGQSYEDARMKEIGFLGEHFVFELLSKCLSDCATPFTYENWTSSFRSLAGFPGFSGDEVSDFAYHDTEGVLTRRLFPSVEAHLSGSPKYFIEVKSTSGDQARPFFMKKRQFLEAFRMSRSNQEEDAPLQLYVLFRVSSIGGQGTPVLRPYVDPHDMLSRGTLRIESDSVQVRIVGE